MNKNEMIYPDLPSLQSIHLGVYALRGREDDDSCSLIMRSMNDMNGMIKSRSSKSTIH